MDERAEMILEMCGGEKTVMGDFLVGSSLFSRLINGIVFRQVDMIRNPDERDSAAEERGNRVRWIRWMSEFVVSFQERLERGQ